MQVKCQDASSLCGRQTFQKTILFIFIWIRKRACLWFCRYYCLRRIHSYGSLGKVGLAKRLSGNTWSAALLQELSSGTYPSTFTGGTWAVWPGHIMGRSGVPRLTVALCPTSCQLWCSVHHDHSLNQKIHDEVIAQLSLTRLKTKRMREW